CPSPPSPSLRHCRRRCPYAGDGYPCPSAATLPRGDHPYDRRCHARPPGLQAHLWALCPQVAATVGGCRAIGCHSYRRRAAGGCPCRGPWPKPTAPLQVARSWPTAPVGGLAVASHTCRGPGRGRPPSFLATFTAKMQQERVE
ncbi:hypothetical protein BHE74_00030281, partial [Ensete ventricosum]